MVFDFSSIILDILNISRMNTAQSDAAMPIRATTLLPLKGGQNQEG
jgi:hypothetical protein